MLFKKLKRVFLNVLFRIYKPLKNFFAINAVNGCAVNNFFNC